MRRVLLVAAAPVLAYLAVGPVADRLARRLMDAPRRLPEELGMAPALDRLGGEVVRLRSRDGLRLSARWLDAQPGEGWAPDPHEAILLLHGWSGSVTPDLLEWSVPAADRGRAGPGLPGARGVRRRADQLRADRGRGRGRCARLAGRAGHPRVALVGSSMGGITAIAAVAVLGDGRLASADADPAAPAAHVDAPRPRIVAVVADSVTPELALVVANRMRIPFGRRIADHAFARMARRLGGDPRDTEPIAVIGLLEDLPLLLVHGTGDADGAPAGRGPPGRRGAGRRPSPRDRGRRAR